MTAPTDPSDPTDPTAAADRDWFRAQVDPVLSAEPADGWPMIEARLDGAPVAPTPLPTAQRRTTRRWLAAAAVVAVVGAVAGAIALATGSSDDGTTLQSGTAADTGWYLPVDLPDGWTIQSVDATRGDAACEAWGTEWTAPGDGAVSLTYDRCPDTYQADADARDRETTTLDGGISATGPWYLEGVDGADGPRVLHWDDDGAWTVRGAGITDEQAIAIANAAIADPQRTDIPVPGFELLDRWSRPQRDRTPTVTVTYAAPSGRRGSYELTLPGTWISEAGFHLLDPTEVAGQALPVAKVLDPPHPPGSSSWSSLRYRGRWPGADVDVHRIVIEDAPKEDEITDAELETLIGSLRPASSDEWQAFLDGVDAVSPGLRRAATLADVGASGQRSTTTSPDGPIDPTTTIPGPTPGETPGSVVSGPGVLTPRDETYQSFTPLEDLDIRLELASDVVRAGSPVEGTLIMRNTSDRDIEFGECSKYLTEWGLIPAGAPTAELPERRIVDCYANQPNIDAGQTVRFPLDWVEPSGFVAQRPADDGWGVRGALPGGDYLAVVQIPGRSSDLRITIPVTVPDPPCTTTDDDVEAYLRHSIEGSKDVAAQRGDEVRLVAIDGKQLVREDDLRCDRINIEIDGGQVVNAVRY